MCDVSQRFTAGKLSGNIIVAAVFHLVLDSERVDYANGADEVKTDGAVKSTSRSVFIGVSLIDRSAADKTKVLASGEPSHAAYSRSTGRENEKRHLLRRIHRNISFETLHRCAQFLISL